jgi:hypothetical protein
VNWTFPSYTTSGVTVSQTGAGTGSLEGAGNFVLTSPIEVDTPTARAP